MTLLLLCLGWVGLLAQTGPSYPKGLDWQNLQNPILANPDWSIKDAAMAYRKGTYYLFFSAFYPRESNAISHVVEVSTRDFKTFSKPLFEMDGHEDGWLGMCSPDVQQLNGKYVMTFNSWGDKPDKPNQLFYATSKDLVHWSRRQTLAPNLTTHNRVIDPALTVADGGYYLIWKEGKLGTNRPRLAFSKTLKGPYAYVVDGLPILVRKDGIEPGLTPKTYQENFEFLHADGKQYLLTTDHGPIRAHLYELVPNTHWLKWSNGYALDIPRESFNTADRDNAAAVYDWRQYDGYFYMIYAGTTERTTFMGRGWNRLAIARSKDLIHWVTPGSLE